MRTTSIHLVRQNILCFGPEGIEIHFGDHGQVVQVVGINLDMPGSEDIPGSNGSGKSSIQEILSIGFYGTTVKKPTKNKGMQIINTLADKGEVEVQWDDYRLLRTFKKKASGGIEGKLQLWKSANRIWDKQSEVDRLKHDYEEEIKRAIGLTHHAFCNVVVFDDSSDYSFLEADAATKREIVENLLDLDQYRGYHENAKKGLKDLKEKIVVLTRDYSHALEYVESCERRIADVKKKETNWVLVRAGEIETLAQRIEEKRRLLSDTDNGQEEMWQSAQDGIVKRRDENIDLEAKLKRLEEILVVAREKTDTARSERTAIKEEISRRTIVMNEASAALVRVRKLSEKLENLEEGTPCPYCHGTIHRMNHEHVLDQSRDEMSRHEQTVLEEAEAIKAEHEKYDKKTASIAVMEEKIREAEGKRATFNKKITTNRSEISKLSTYPKPEPNATERVLEAEITELKKQLKARQDEISGGSPYKEIIEQAEAEKTQKESERDGKAEELRVAEEDAPYYQFWVEAFGDNGIRKFVIEGIVPSLNERVAYWMDILCDGLIEITFDNTFKETMTRNGNAAAYSNTSNGEKRRINLAVSQAFAYVMMLNSGTCPSVVFLDEITGGGIDRAGIPGVHDMIFELAKERQVFVTTHNETLSNLMQGCETITLKKQNDITVLVS